MGSFAEKTEILRKAEASKERMRGIVMGREKEDDRSNMMGRLYKYTSNLSKVNDFIKEGKIEFATMARRYEAEIERIEGEMDALDGGGLVIQRKRGKINSVLAQYASSSEDSSITSDGRGNGRRKCIVTLCKN